MPHSLICLVVFLALYPDSARAEQKKIVVPSVAVSGVSDTVGVVVTELILEALLNRHGVRALGPSDFKDMLDQEQQRLLVGCDQSSCMAQIAGAMGAEYLISGMVGRLGDLHVVTLKLLDTDTAQVSARASRRFRRIEDVPDAVGPLVDDLLNAKPRTSQATPMVLKGTAAPEKKVRTMSVRGFCKRVKSYATSIAKKPFSRAMIQDRRALLSDMLHTPFLREFDQKTACVRDKGNLVMNALHRKILAGTKEEQVVDARRRREEWREMVRLLELLIEAYHTGYEKEKNGAGVRPSSLPFAITERTLEPPENTADLRRFLDDYESAQKTLKRALDTREKKQKKAFFALWTPKDPKRSRTSVKYIWERVVKYEKNGYAVDLCPIYILSASQIESSANDYAKTGLLQACYRRKKDKYVTTDRVRMKHVPSKGWLIDRW